jgi:formylglycine-generating enzyme
MNHRPAIRTGLAILASLSAVSACSALVGVEEFTADSDAGSDAGTPDGTVAAESGLTNETGTNMDAGGTSDACAPSGTGAVGTIGCPCVGSATLACNGNAQRVILMCSGGVWAESSTCPSAQNCDTTPGASQGTCAPIEPLCALASPGDKVCFNGTTVVQCGPDLVSTTPVTTCAGMTPACLGGSCVPCSPTATQCFNGAVQTCVAGGQWGSIVWDSGAACVNTAFPYCFNGACSAVQPSCPQPAAGCAASTESCCASGDVITGVTLDAATYYRTYTNPGDGGSAEADPASVTPFQMDLFEVTVGRFRQFVTAWNAGYTPPQGSGTHWTLNGGRGLVNASPDAGVRYETGWVTSDDANIAPTDVNLDCDADFATWTAAPGNNEYRPINCVNWYEAYAFCIWDGGYLPSEAEWEFAAAGGSAELEYPWGSTPPGDESQYAIFGWVGSFGSHAGGCEYPTPGGECTGVSNIAPVGTASKGGGLWGQLDLGGNVNEWNLDWFAPYVDPCSDCADLTPATDRVMRGGDFEEAAGGIPVPGYQPAPFAPPIRSSQSPTIRASGTGLRCARPLVVEGW